MSWEHTLAAVLKCAGAAQQPAAAAVVVRFHILTEFTSKLHWHPLGMQAQHSSQQQQWERDLAQLQLEMGGAATGQLPSGAAAPGDEAAAAQHWSRIRDSVFLHMRRVLDSFAADRTV